MTLPKNFTARPATMDDVEAAVELVNACSIEQIGRPEWEVHQFRNDWQSPNLNPETDLWVVFTPDDKLVGYAGVWDRVPYVRMHGWGNVHPLWFLALDGDEIVGMSLCRLKMAEDPGMGYVDTLGVRRPWRRRGVALALLHHSFGELYRRGQRRVSLDVDAQSLTGATRVYEKAGMHVQRQTITYEKELRSGRDLSTRSVENQ